MTHDARDVANILILRGVEDDNYLTPLQVVKLVYYCHAWTLVWFDRPLIHQKIEAWQYGPVIADVYESVKKYGRDPILAPIPGIVREEYDEDEEMAIDAIYEHYGALTGPQLSTMTHKPGSPWDQIWHSKGVYFWRTFRQQPVIPDTLIKDYYGSLGDG